MILPFLLRPIVRLAPVLSFVLLFGAMRAVAAEPASGRPPNIVLVLADDLGWADTVVYGSKYYETPSIDRLAREGVRFEHHHAHPNCTPSRAALMTGQYGPRTGLYTVGDIDRFDWRSRPLRPMENGEGLPLDRTTAAQILRAAGYRTAMFGKWHLGESPEQHPARRGFDEAIEAAGRHYGFKTDPPAEIPEGTYLARYLTDRALDFIARSKAGPFFLYLPHFAVHAPIQPEPEKAARFRAKPASGGQGNPDYAAMIASLDESVGRILAALEEHGISNNTIVIFTSDNGGVGGYAREGIKGGEITDNAPLRGGKGMLYEGGIRVPLVVRGPGIGPAGSIRSTPTAMVDLLPTLIEWAGARTPEGPFDGESLVPLLRDPEAKLARKAIYQHFPGYLGGGGGTWRTTPGGVIQEDSWKLLEFFEEGRVELYDLASDPGERRDLAAEQPERAREMRERLEKWRREVNAPMPVRRTPGTGD